MVRSGRLPGRRLVGACRSGARRAVARRAIAPAGAGNANAHGAARDRRDARARPIQVLYLGSDEETPHNPAKMFPLLAAPLARRGIQLTYARTPADALDAGKARVLRRRDDLWRPHRR